jgi:hypothetical protein
VTKPARPSGGTGRQRFEQGFEPARLGDDVAVDEQDDVSGRPGRAEILLLVIAGRRRGPIEQLRGPWPKPLHRRLQPGVVDLCRIMDEQDFGRADQPGRQSGELIVEPGEHPAGAAEADSAGILALDHDRKSRRGHEREG